VSVLLVPDENKEFPRSPILPKADDPEVFLDFFSLVGNGESFAGAGAGLL